MKYFLLTLWAMLTGKYWKQHWALECARKRLVQWDRPQNGYTTICLALEYVTEASPEAVQRAIGYIGTRIFPYRTLPGLLSNMGLFSPELNLMDYKEILLSREYHYHRDRWLEEAVKELKRLGL